MLKSLEEIRNVKKGSKEIWLKYLYNTKEEVDRLIEALNNQDRVFDTLV